MNKRVSLWLAVLIASVTFLAGGATSWWISQHGLLSLSLAHELETTGLCANGLKLAEVESSDRLVLLLEHRLESAVQHSSALVDAGAHLFGPSPNLKDSVRRAASYYAGSGNVDKQRSAEKLLARLENAK